MTSILLADNNSLIRDALKLLLESHGDMTVIGEAANGNEVLDLISGGVDADLVISSMKMPVCNGLSLTLNLKLLFPGIRILIHTATTDAVQILEVLRAGADGYVLKGAGIEELILAVNEVTAGKRYICPETRKYFLDPFLNSLLSKKANQPSINCFPCF
jgi:DNA-binding NarL/FixJ family response regulator